MLLIAWVICKNCTPRRASTL